MSFLGEILFDFILQMAGQLVCDIIFGIGDLATRGRMRRVSVFMFAGAGMGLLSHFFWPRLLFPDSVTRYLAVAAMAIAAGLVLAMVDARVRRGGRGAATAGFLSGVAFSLAYAGMRHLMRV